MAIQRVAAKILQTGVICLNCPRVWLRSRTGPTSSQDIPLLQLSALQTSTAESFQATATNGAKSTQTPEAATTTGAVQTPSTIATERKDDGQKVVAVGAGVSVGVGVPLLAALGAVLFLYVREKRITQRPQKSACGLVLVASMVRNEKRHFLDWIDCKNFSREWCTRNFQLRGKTSMQSLIPR